MTNYEKYAKAFCDVLNIEREKLAGLTYQSIVSWDSIGHLALVAALEEAFGITLDIDDMIDLSSFEKGMEILNKYDVQF